MMDIQDIESRPDVYAELSDGMRICYRRHGRPDAEAILLIAGLGLQLVYWPAALIQAFVEAGYQVITPDNRDVGRSTRIERRPPTKLRQLMGWAPTGNYSLDDMADDMVQLMDVLGIGRVHAVGMSMGGMIAQTLAARHADRVSTLTSIFSTTGHPAVGQPAPSTLFKMMLAGEPHTESEAVLRYIQMMRHIGDPTVPGIEAVWTRYTRLAWERGGFKGNANGMARQIGAIQKSGDRTPQLRRITAPTLVLHGDIDLIVHPSGGRATAQAISGAVFETIEGMRHQIDPERSPQLSARILAHVRPHSRPVSTASPLSESTTA